jgi:flagellar basal body-associated protein FliL
LFYQKPKKMNSKLNIYIVRTIVLFVISVCGITYITMSAVITVPK